MHVEILIGIVDAVGQQKIDIKFPFRFDVLGATPENRKKNFIGNVNLNLTECIDAVLTDYETRLTTAVQAEEKRVADEKRAAEKKKEQEKANAIKPPEGPKEAPAAKKPA